MTLFKFILIPATILTLPLFHSISFSQVPTKSEKKSCEKMVNDFCDQIWKPPYLGNYDVRDGQLHWPLRLGRTPNDIDQTQFMFLEALRKNTSKLPNQIQLAFKKTDFEKNLNDVLTRKVPKQRKFTDLSQPAYIREINDSLKEAMRLVSLERTAAQHPGLLQLAKHQWSPKQITDYHKNLDVAWSELFTAVWSTDEAWKNVQKLFDQVRAEYENQIEDDTTLSANFKKDLLANLKSLKLVIPGSNLDYSNSTSWQSCGIDMKNAFYLANQHEVTVCAGQFNSALSLLTIAHEVGHSVSLGKRQLDYVSQTDYAKDMLQLWNRTHEGKPLSCTEWKKVKTDLVKHAENLPNYKYEDEKKLDKYLDRKLEPVPEGAELKKLADKLSKKTLRELVNYRSIESIIKPQDILLDGTQVENYRYLKPSLNGIRWPKPISSLMNDGLQFELLFTSEYACALENKVPSGKALKESIEEATKLLSYAWMVQLRVPGRFSGLQEARDEEFAQDIEEDVVDSHASLIVSRLLKKIKSVSERQNTYLASMANSCDEPSFAQKFPDETLILHKFSNRPHSVGNDRRMKMLTPEIREALQCE